VKRTDFASEYWTKLPNHGTKMELKNFLFQLVSSLWTAGGETEAHYSSQTEVNIKFSIFQATEFLLISLIYLVLILEMFCFRANTAKIDNNFDGK